MQCHAQRHQRHVRRHSAARQHRPQPAAGHRERRRRGQLECGQGLRHRIQSELHAGPGLEVELLAPQRRSARCARRSSRSRLATPASATCRPQPRLGVLPGVLGVGLVDDVADVAQRPCAAEPPGRARRRPRGPGCRRRAPAATPAGRGQRPGPLVGLVEPRDHGLLLLRAGPGPRARRRSHAASWAATKSTSWATEPACRVSGCRTTSPRKSTSGAKPLSSLSAGSRAARSRRNEDTGRTGMSSPASTRCPRCGLHDLAPVLVEVRLGDHQGGPRAALPRRSRGNRARARSAPGMRR